MPKPVLILVSLIVFSLFSLSSSLSSGTVLNAADILSNSGFVSMALTLELLSATQTLTSQPPSATIFSPSDAAFAESGQPSLSLLQFHFSPLAFSLESLRSLPFGSKIPTMSSGKSLSVTTLASNQQVSLNNVTINGSPVYDDGLLVIYGIDEFFDPNFDVLVTTQSPSPDLRCIVSTSNPNSSVRLYSFDEASEMLRSRGYSVMASFLDLQLLGFLDRPKLTVFAPVDDVTLEFVSNFSEYLSLFRRHVVPCWLRWKDLANFQDGTVLSTFLEGFTIKITKLNDQLTLNDVPVTFQDMYYSDWLVVHGLGEVLNQPETPENEAEPSSEFGSEEWISPDRSEF